MLSPLTSPLPAARRRRRIVGVSLALLAVLALTSGIYLAHRAMVAKAALEDAQSQLTAFRTTLDPSRQLSTATLYEKVQADTARAVAQSDDPVWRLAEHLPVAGSNLRAFRQTTTLVDDLVRDGAGPVARAVDGLSLDTLKPDRGRVDIEPLRRLAPATVALDEAVQRAQTDARGIDTRHVVPQLSSKVHEIQQLLDRVGPPVDTMRQVVPLLYPALGGSGSRNYLLMFQNNAEERASGGNPASMAMLRVDDGRVSLGRQASSHDFPRPFGKAPYTPSGTGNADWDKLFSSLADTYVTNITMTPDFPSTATMARAMWLDVYGGKVDGVISLDPVALSYLLEVSGPVTLSNGYRLTSQNATSYLLYDVYARYPDSGQQDEVFASAAKTIFTALTSGGADPAAYLRALEPAVDEQRLKMWSVDKAEQSVLATSPVGTMLPPDNSSKTVLGVYNNEDSWSKMSYFIDEKVDVLRSSCPAGPSYAVTATITNTVSKEQAPSLPTYVRAKRSGVAPGGDRQWVMMFGPVGGSLSEVRVDGEPITWSDSFDEVRHVNPRGTGETRRRPAVQGVLHGRPVGVVGVYLDPKASTTVTATFSGQPDDSPVMDVSHTPKVRPVPVSFTDAPCRG